MTRKHLPTRAAQLVAAALALSVTLLTPLPPGVAADPAPFYDDVVAAVLALPYNPAAASAGLDDAFGPDDYPAAFPLTDLAGGACCTGPVPDQPPLADLAPPFADFPDGFGLIELASYDGTPLHAFAALRPGAPGVVVMHGFNTNGKHSIVRYAAFLYANGYSVIAPDHRDMGREWARGGSWHPDGTRHGQTLGWKEAQDLLTAAEWLADAGIERIGVLGFSEGAQNTILALGIDHDGIIDAALTFSPPADQKSLIQRSPATTAALLTTVVGNPDVCDYLSTVGARPEFGATPNYILAHDSAVDTLDGVIGGASPAPALHFFTADDTLVPSWNATALASRTNAMANQHTVLLTTGNHAYFTDRWWTQMAALTWFGAWLDPAGQTAGVATVAQTPGGPPAADQQVDLTGVSRADGDAELRRGDVCPAGAPTGPRADLHTDGVGLDWVLDGRRSYSGWDEHRIASWSIDPGDGSGAAAGTDITAARVDHRYPVPGTYTATLTVTDDTGRTATATATIDATPPSAGGSPAATGGGWLVAAGGAKINFGFTARPGGRLRLHDRSAGTSVRIDDITTIGPVQPGCGSIGADPAAVEFRGVGDLDGQPASFRVCVVDAGEPGTSAAGGSDRFHLECLTGCAYTTAATSTDDAIDGGNIQVHAAAGSSGASPSAASSPAVLVLEPVLPTDGPLTAFAYDAAGRPVSGASVVLVGVATGEVLAGITGADGVASFPAAAPAADYVVRAGDLSSNAATVAAP